MQYFDWSVNPIFYQSVFVLIILPLLYVWSIHSSALYTCSYHRSQHSTFKHVVLTFYVCRVILNLVAPIILTNVLAIDAFTLYIFMDIIVKYFITTCEMYLNMFNQPKRHRNMIITFPPYVLITILAKNMCYLNSTWWTLDTLISEWIAACHYNNITPYYLLKLDKIDNHKLVFFSHPAVC